jgi:hypothetical protein
VGVADIVNLRQARKRKARDARDKAADANRIAHGRSRSEKSLAAAQNRLMENRLDQGRIEPASPDPAPSQTDP